MDPIKKKFEQTAKEQALEIKDLVKEHGEYVLGNYTVKNIYSGMRGVLSMVTETSLLDPVEGIRFRGYSLPELRDLLPKVDGGKEPLPEGLFYLMLIGKVPDSADVKYISEQWSKRGAVPEHVFKMLDSLPTDTHPMTQFSMAILALRTESVFADSYAKGLSKKDYWDPFYEDTMNLIARLPRVAAYIYRRSYKGGKHIEPRQDLDWAGNFAHMLGYEDDNVKRLMRLYMTIHADHEGGNVSAHTTHLVGSALSDAYYSLSAGMNGLAGPLHGLANQEVVKWILELKEHHGNRVPDRDEIAAYIKKTLSEGKVIPGYGHAVLRKTDPRYSVQQDFAEENLPDDENFRIVKMIYEVAPDILESTGKVKNPWPNVDAHSGVILMHYGIKEYEFYTVLFGVSRALGVLSSLIWDRALAHPIERPKSVTTAWVKEAVKKTATIS